MYIYSFLYLLLPLLHRFTGSRSSTGALVPKDISSCLVGTPSRTRCSSNGTFDPLIYTYMRTFLELLLVLFELRVLLLYILLPVVLLVMLLEVVIVSGQASIPLRDKSIGLSVPWRSKKPQSWQLAGPMLGNQRSTVLPRGGSGHIK